jgi:hypothetical protein
MVFPGDLLTFKGKSGQKGGNGGESYITCQVWAENPKGQILVEGSAVISLG